MASIRWFGHALGLAVASGCSFTADLDSLTAGNGVSRDETSDGTSEDDASRPRAQTNSNETSESSVTSGATSARDEQSSCEGGCTAAEGTSTGSAHDASSNDAPSNDAPSNDADSLGQTSTDPSTMHGSPASTPPPSSDETAPMPSSATSSGPTSSSADTSSDTTDDCGNGNCGNASLIHRYSFTNISTSLTDSIGNLPGTVVGTATEVDGKMVVAGDGYAAFPAEAVSGLTDATLEIWFTSYETQPWERIFDLGDTAEGSSKSYLFLTSQTPSSHGAPRVAFRPTGKTERTVNSAVEVTNNTPTHAAVVFDSTNNRMAIYLNGQPAGSAPSNGSLAEVNIENVWLGHSLFANDPQFEGEFDEFRVYAGTLNAAQVKQSFDLGPDQIAE